MPRMLCNFSSARRRLSSKAAPTYQGVPTHDNKCYQGACQKTDIYIRWCIEAVNIMIILYTGHRRDKKYLTLGQPLEFIEYLKGTSRNEGLHLANCRSKFLEHWTKSR